MDALKLTLRLSGRPVLALTFLIALVVAQGDQTSGHYGAAGGQPPSAAPGEAASSLSPLGPEKAVLAKRWPAGQKLSGWPHAGTITSPFGARTGGFHNGLDIAAPYFTPVRAAASGIVQAVGKAYMSYGDSAEAVIIAHSSDLSTLYGHLDDRARPPIVRPGQLVQAGQIIGYVGSTGWSTGPHTHFTTIFDGRPIDPLVLLP